MGDKVTKWEKRYEWNNADPLAQCADNQFSWDAIEALRNAVGKLEKAMNVKRKLRELWRAEEYASDRILDLEHIMFGIGKEAGQSLPERLAKLEAVQPAAPAAPWREVLQGLVEAVKVYFGMTLQEYMSYLRSEYGGAEGVAYADALDAADALLAAPVQAEDDALHPGDLEDTP